jgi:multisubunit Na+/H+ antiporter MnhB subunit
MNNEPEIGTEAPASSSAPARDEQTQNLTQRTELSEFIARVIGFSVVLGPLLYLFVWKNLPWGATTKLIVIAAVFVGFALVYIFFKAKTEKFFKLMSNAIVVILIVFGAVILSIFFTTQDQAQIFKIFTVLYFSLLPPWLYLQFISTKGKTLWDEYVLNLFRLHVDHYAYLPAPPKRSIFYEAWRKSYEKEKLRGLPEGGKSIYEKKFEGLFGPVGQDESLTLAVFRGENLWPVAFATLIISVGWVMAVQPDTILRLSFLPQDFQPSGTPQIPLETFRFAFLGAYFYVLQMLVRRYFQNDLKSSAYVNSIMRFIVVILLVWTIDLIGREQVSQAQRSMLAFVIGVFPHVGWQALQALIKWPIKLVVPSLRQQYPLSDLDGLNIWYESRLLEEGIEDMQNLATANLVDVMLNTRIPVERLVDWVDQSLLYLHLGTQKTDDGESSREKLRRFGIRSATDLEDVFASNGGIRTAGNEDNREHIKKMEYILNPDEEGPSILRSLLAALSNEPNFYHVTKWKTFAREQLNVIGSDTESRDSHDA